jgi:hypothetical protein
MPIIIFPAMLSGIGNASKNNTNIPKKKYTKAIVDLNIRKTLFHPFMCI